MQRDTPSKKPENLLTEDLYDPDVGGVGEYNIDDFIRYILSDITIYSNFKKRRGQKIN